MAAVGGNKRRRTSPESPACFTDLPDVLLVGVAQYLSMPYRALLAVAMNPTQPSSASVPSATLSPSWPPPTTTSRAILTASLDIHEGDDQDDEPWEVLDFIEFEEKSLVTKHREEYLPWSGAPELYHHDWTETHYGEVGNDTCKKLTDDDIGAILTIIDAVNNVKTLKLAGCINITGLGLTPLRGSTVLQHIDLSLVGPHESTVIKPEPKISEDDVIPILDSIIEVNGSSLEYLFFPKNWREERSSMLAQFIGRYNQRMEGSQIKCSGYSDDPGCGRPCQDTDAGGRRPWMIQNSSDFPHMSDPDMHFLIRMAGFSPPRHGNYFVKRWGMQRFTCGKCFKHTCYDCTGGVESDGHYNTHELCVKCEKQFCAPCGLPDERCRRCHDFLCDECKRGEDGELIECSCGCGDICQDCLATCKSCNKSGCSGFDCLEFKECHGKKCEKKHCVNCFDGKEYDVELCDNCQKSFCFGCRYSSCSKDWAKACTDCMIKINVRIPIRNRSPYSFYYNSVRDNVEAANQRLLGWGVGQIIIKQYKALSDKQRAYWDKKSADDKDRYGREIVEFEEMYGIVSSQTPMFMYTNSVRIDIKAANPTASIGGIETICSKQFDALPQEEIDYWEQQSAFDKEMFEGGD